MSSSSPSERVLPVSFLWTKERPRSAAVPEGAETQLRSDENLMASLKSQDREALAELFRRYSRLVFSIGLRILRDIGEAEEIVQDVFLFLYERARLFDENKGGARAWVVQVAHHRSLDRQGYLRRRNFYCKRLVFPPSTCGCRLATMETWQRASVRVRRTVAEKRRIVELTLLPGASVARVAQAEGVNSHQVFQWRRAYRAGKLVEFGEAAASLCCRYCCSNGSHGAVAARAGRHPEASVIAAARFTSSFQAASRSLWSTVRTVRCCKRFWRACASDRTSHRHAHLDRGGRDRHAARLSGAECAGADDPQAAAIFRTRLYFSRAQRRHDQDFMGR